MLLLEGKTGYRAGALKLPSMIIECPVTLRGRIGTEPDGSFRRFERIADTTQGNRGCNILPNHLSGRRGRPAHSPTQAWA
mgnify:CR=1 FL=1